MHLEIVRLLRRQVERYRLVFVSLEDQGELTTIASKRQGLRDVGGNARHAPLGQ